MRDDYQFTDRRARRKGDTGHTQVKKLKYLAGIRARIHAKLKSRVPLGYEDETGFHIGAIPSKEKRRD